MTEKLAFAQTDSLALTLPQRPMHDVRELIEHMASLESSTSVLPKGEGLAASIERVREEVSRWTERLSADARIGFERYVQRHPERKEDALKRLDTILSTYHDRVAAIIKKAESYCCEVYDSVDAKEFSRALRARLGVPESMPDSAVKVETHDRLAGDKFTFFEESAETVIATAKPPIERFMDALTEADSQKLMIDAGSIDDAQRRERFVRSVVASVAGGLKEQEFSQEEMEKIVQSVLSMLQEMRMGHNPYTLKVSSRTMLGLLPEIPRMDGNDPAAAFAQWRDARKTNEEDSEEPQTQETVMPNQCGIRRGRKLNGNLVAYFNDGEVLEITMQDGRDEANERLEKQIGEWYGADKAKRPAALHFYDKHELEDTILHLPVDRGAVLHLQIRGTDLFCRLYRNETGELVIEDGHGQFPAALRNVNITPERILANPFEFFSARNMRLEMADQAVG